VSISQICEAALEKPVKSSDDITSFAESLIDAISFLNDYHIKLSEKAVEKSRHTMGKILDHLQRSLHGLLKSLMPPIGKSSQIFLPMLCVDAGWDVFVYPIDSI
jgi:hypothetical protein